MIEERVVWEGYLSVAIPDGWQHEEDNGTISIFDPEGVGALQISFARGPEDVDINLHEWSQNFANNAGLGTVDPREAMLAGIAASTFEALSHDNEPTYWRIWHCGSHGRVATISYLCAADDRDTERPTIDRLVNSIRWLY